MSSRYLVVLFCILVFMDGALRKWVWPEYGMQLFLVKDAILCLALATYLVRSRGVVAVPRINRTVLVLAGLYSLTAIVQMFNPRLPSLAIGVLGVKSHVAYLTLLVLVPATFPERQVMQTRVLLLYLLSVALPILSLGIYQYFQAPSHWINIYTAEEAGISVAGFEHRPRVTGTFSYITGMTTFLLLNLSLSVGLTMTGIRHGGWMLWVGLCLLVLTLIVGPMNGSRAFAIYPLIGLPVLAWLILRRGLVRGRLVLAIGIVGMVSFALMGTAALSGWESLAQRSQSSQDERARLISATAGAVDRMLVAGPWGYGAGATHQAAPRLAPDVVRYAWLPDIYFEEENGRVGMELGWIGFLLYVCLKLMAISMAYQLCKRASTPMELLVGITAILFLCAHLVPGIVFNPIAGACFWGMTGIVACLRAQQEHRLLSRRELAWGRGWPPAELLGEVKR